MIEGLLDIDNNSKVRGNWMHWDKSDCGIIGLVEIYLRQLIDEHKKNNGVYYDTDYDEIVLRYK